MTGEGKDVPFSVVLPVHNEEEMVPYAIPTIFMLNPEEVVVLFDRCTDRSELYTRRVWKRHFSHIDLKVINVEEKSGWRKHLNYLYDLGIREAAEDIVLLVQADIQYDYKTISRNIHLAEGAMVSFGVAGHPLHNPWNWAVTRMLRKLFEGFSGTVALSKQIYREIALTPDSIHNFDTHLFSYAKRRRLPYRFVDTRSLHLRPNFRFSLRFNKVLWNLGVAKYKAGKSFFKVLGWSLVRMTPFVIAGWIHAKLSDDELQK